MVWEWLVVGLGPGGFDSCDPRKWKGFLLKGTRFESQTTGPQTNKYTPAV